MALIRVINPNSNDEVTDAIAAGVAPFTIPGRIDIICETLEEGPFGIQSQRDVDTVVLPLAARMKARPADAFVIACYSDPGLALCRDEIEQPVFGIMESAILTARTRGYRFGVIALSETSIRRHMRLHDALGVSAWCAGERAVDLSVADTAGAEVFERLAEAGRLLVTADRADVVILGCAGMARHRAPLEATLGIPVIDPSQAAVGVALSSLLARPETPKP